MNLFLNKGEDNMQKKHKYNIKTIQLKILLTKVNLKRLVVKKLLPINKEAIKKARLSLEVNINVNWRKLNKNIKIFIEKMLVNSIRSRKDMR